MKFPAEGFNSEPPEGFIYLAALLNFAMEANAEPLDIVCNSQFILLSSDSLKHSTDMGSSTSRHYVVSYPLGSGRNSLVFAARDMMNQRQVCILLSLCQKHPWDKENILEKESFMLKMKSLTQYLAPTLPQLANCFVLNCPRPFHCKGVIHQLQHLLRQ